MASQDFIGFAKAPLKNQSMMEYEFIEGEADQLKDDLIHGRVTNNQYQEALDSDELEALEEEERLV